MIIYFRQEVFYGLYSRIIQQMMIKITVQEIKIWPYCQMIYTNKESVLENKIQIIL